MDIVQDDTHQWGDRLNAAIHNFKEQMDMILEARSDMARCQHIFRHKCKDRELALAQHSRQAHHHLEQIRSVDKYCLYRIIIEGTPPCTIPVIQMGKIAGLI